MVLNNLRQLIESDAQDLIQSLREQIAIPSVEGAPEEGAPFGKAVADSLDHILALGERMGFRIKNHDGYVGTIEWGEGEIIGVLSHVDVVPPGDLSAWSSDPYTLTEKDEFLLGRGVADDKGPLLSCLYGMYALKKLGFTPKKCIRVIIGTNEETGWGCMDYYKKNLEAPACSFSPDGMYTVVNREKGILGADFSKTIHANGATICGGEAGNLVPARAAAWLPCAASAVDAAVAGYLAPEGMTITTAEKAGGTEVICTGKNAPSHSPAKGISAIEGLLHVIAQCKTAPAALAAACGDLLSLLGEAPDGQAMGIDCADDVSGSLTTNLGMISLAENTLSVKMDVRAPVTFSLSEIAEKVSKAFADKGFAEASMHLKHPLYVPADSDFIRTLCSVYETVTGEDAVLSSIGGGTYARAFANCVCFGAVYPTEELTVHAPNERALKKNLLQNAVMYGYALYELTK